MLQMDWFFLCIPSGGIMESRGITKEEEITENNILINVFEWRENCRHV
jgi:hypothetical protein